MKVGGATETEMKERKALYEDAHAATKAALEEGIVPGGGVALLQARKVLEKAGRAEGDEAHGQRVLFAALAMPARLIAENAGKDGTVVVANILKGKDKNYGYNADTDEYEDLRKAGVVDPVKVTRAACRTGPASPACCSPVRASSPTCRSRRRPAAATITTTTRWAAWVGWEAWAGWAGWAGMM